MNVRLNRSQYNLLVHVVIVMTLVTQNASIDLQITAIVSCKGECLSLANYQFPRLLNVMTDVSICSYFISVNFYF